MHSSFIGSPRVSELRESVAQCLEELGVSEFAAALNGSDLSSRLANPDEELTVFAPTNEAVNGVFLDQRALNAHIVEEIVRNSDLRDGTVLRPLDDTTLLHITDVHGYRDMEFTEVSTSTGVCVCAGCDFHYCRPPSSMEQRSTQVMHV